MTIDLHTEEVCLPGRTMVASIVLFVLAVGDLLYDLVGAIVAATAGAAYLGEVSRQLADRLET